VFDLRTTCFTNGSLEHNLFVSQESRRLELKRCKQDFFSVFSCVLDGITCMCFVAYMLQNFLASYVLGQLRSQNCAFTCVLLWKEKGEHVWLVLPVVWRWSLSRYSSLCGLKPQSFCFVCMFDFKLSVILKCPLF
jgi:hypothetical protein